METPLNVADLAIAIAPLSPDVRVVDADGQNVTLHLVQVDGVQCLMVGAEAEVVVPGESRPGARLIAKAGEGRA